MMNGLHGKMRYLFEIFCKRIGNLLSKLNINFEVSNLIKSKNFVFSKQSQNLMTIAIHNILFNLTNGVLIPKIILSYFK